MSISFQGTDKRRRRISIVGLFVMSLMSIGMFAQSRDYPPSDPATPSPGYVLGKLNDHLIVNAQNIDHIEAMGQRIAKLEATNIGERMVKMESNVDFIKWSIMTLVGGLATMLIKDILPKVRFGRYDAE